MISLKNQNHLKKKFNSFLDIKADRIKLILDEKVIKKNKDIFYSNLNNFLIWIKELKSSLVICTHPYYNFKERKKFIKNLELYKVKLIISTSAI